MPPAALETKKHMGSRPIKPGWITAKTADIHDLYERSVQCPESEVNLVYQAWRELRDRKPFIIREDFSAYPTGLQTM